MLLVDDIAQHPKAIAAGPVGAWLWVACIGYARRFGTGGVVPREVLRSWGQFRRPLTLAAQLAEVGLLEVVDSGFRVHDFEVYNDPPDRRAAGERQGSPWSSSTARVAAYRARQRAAGIVTSRVTGRVTSTVTESVTGLSLGSGLVRRDVGESEGEKGQVSAKSAAAHLTPAAVWATWRRVVENETGSSPVPKPSTNETESCRLLSASGYTIAQLESCMRLLCVSPHFAGKRSLGMLRANVAQLDAWGRDHPGTPFGERPRPGVTTPRLVAADTCPHTPPCTHVGACKLRQVREGLLVIDPPRAAVGGHP